MAKATITFSPAKASVSKSIPYRMTADQRKRLSEIKDIRNKPLDFAQSLKQEMDIRGRQTTIMERYDGKVIATVTGEHYSRLKKVCKAYRSWMVKLMLKAAGVSVEYNIEE